MLRRIMSYIQPPPQNNILQPLQTLKTKPTLTSQLPLRQKTKNTVISSTTAAYTATRV